LLLRQ